MEAFRCGFDIPWHDIVKTEERRKYALTRIPNVQWTGKALLRRPFDIRSELKGMVLFTDGNAEDVRLELECHRSQKSTANPDGSIVLTMKVAHTLNLECFVLH